MAEPSRSSKNATSSWYGSETCPCPAGLVAVRRPSGLPINHRRNGAQTQESRNCAEMSLNVRQGCYMLMESAYRWQMIRRYAMQPGQLKKQLQRQADTLVKQYGAAG